MFSQRLLLGVLCSQTFEDQEGDVHVIVYCFPPPSLYDVVVFVLYLFDRALFLQCSHVTPMQSPYVLNSNVVSYRRILQKKVSVYQQLCKNDTPVNTRKQI